MDILTFWLKSENNNGHIMWIFTHSSACTQHISPNIYQSQKCCKQTGEK
jgi:hypothetical protein